jgi:hypothetical protein
VTLDGSSGWGESCTPYSRFSSTPKSESDPALVPTRNLCLLSYYYTLHQITESESTLVGDLSKQVIILDTMAFWFSSVVASPVTRPH